MQQQGSGQREQDGRSEKQSGKKRGKFGREKMTIILLYTSLFKSEYCLLTSMFSSAPFYPAEPRVTEVKMFGPEGMERKAILRLIPCRSRNDTRRRSMSS
jgi:hypothetical protein